MSAAATGEDVQKKVKKFSWRFLIVVGVFVGAALLFAAITDEIILENENGLDVWAFHRLANIVSPATTRLMLIITFFGSAYFLFPAYILLVSYFLFFKKDTRLSLDVAAVGLTSTGILFWLKNIFHRHRPLDPLVHSVNGFSFPSGHSFSSFTFFGLLIYIIWNHPLNTSLRWVLTIFFLLFAASIALSRVYLHVHFASDVIAGLCLCIVWLSISFWVFQKFPRKLDKA